MEDVHSQIKTTAKRSEVPLDRRNMTFIHTHLTGPEGGGWAFRSTFGHRSSQMLIAMPRQEPHHHHL